MCHTLIPNMPFCSVVGIASTNVHYMSNMKIQIETCLQVSSRSFQELLTVIILFTNIEPPTKRSLNQQPLF